MNTFTTQNATWIVKTITYKVFDSLTRITHKGVMMGGDIPFENLLNTKQEAIKQLVKEIKIADKVYLPEQLNKLQEDGLLDFMEVSEAGDKLVTLFGEAVSKKK